MPGHLLALAFGSLTLTAATSAQTTDHVDSIMQRYAGSVPGASLLVLKNGKAIVRRSYGMADLEAGTKATPATNYRLASVTKQFTAAAILLLVQDHKLSLADPVRRWLPSLPVALDSVTLTHLLTHTSGIIDYEDVMAAVDYAIAKGYADANRLGVGGWSYGGILTNYVITKTDRFKGAVTGASEVLYVANYGHDHYQRLWEQEMGLPWENRELWERLSPFNYVQKIVTPTLIMGGEKDWNVPIINSEQLYQALKRLGRTTQLVVYPGEFHGISKPSYQKDRFERYLAWYDKFVKGEPTASAASAPRD